MTSYHPALIDHITETEWHYWVVAFAHIAGWRTWHDNDSRGNLEGWPDLALISLRGPGFLLVELKKEKGKVTQVQKMMLRDLRNACVSAHVWRPRHRDWVEQALTRRVGIDACPCELCEPAPTPLPPAA